MKKVFILFKVELDVLNFKIKNWNYGKLFCNMLFVEEVLIIFGVFSKVVVCGRN